MNNIIQWFLNNKTLIAGMGLLGLSVYDLSVGNFSQAWQNVLAGMAALGVHVSLDRQAREIKSLHSEAVRDEIQRMAHLP